MADEDEGEDAARVARTLGAIPLGECVAYAKLAIPTIASILGALYLPATAYLDGREDAFRDELVDEFVVKFGFDGEQERVESIRQALTRLESDVEDLESDVEDLESEVSGARAIRQAIAERIGDTRERLIRVESHQDRPR